MANLIVVGSQWGDEGKGKIVDLLAKEAKIIVRYQGGSNAGHTVITNRGTFIFHLVPSGILYRGKLCVLGNGVAIDPGGFIEELDGLIAKGIKVGRNLVISHRAHLIMPYHKAIDRAAEEAKGARRIGTTGRGIGPAYVDKMARIGMRVGDLLNPQGFKRKLEDNLVEINSLLRHIHKTNGFHVDKVYEQYMGYAQRLQGYIADVSLLLEKSINQEKPILFEGAQGTHLDIDFGTYPYVTSSSSCAGGACTGTGVGPTKIDAVLGVTKAYTTRVGGGPFPTELIDEIGENLKAKGQEFGATTGRARRCGWFDALLLRHAVRVNGLTSLAVTKLDVLDGFKELKICNGYRYQGKLYKEMPEDLDILANCTPVYERYPGWTTDTTGITAYKALPAQAKRYLDRIEELTGCPIDMISTGSKREHTIILKSPLVSKKKTSKSRR
ncbi:MAG: adenylosuccinate synthetase [Nitrospirales bacterium]|nr:MAG: adenylosuccinate synthetase [Nitrospirales bacterium]